MHYLLLLCVAPYAVFALIKIILDISGSDMELSPRKLEKIRRRIIKSLVEHGYETSVKDGNDYVIYRDTKWRFSIVKNNYGSASIWIDVCYTLSEAFPNVNADGIRLAAAYASSENPTINVIIRDRSASYCAAVFRFDSVSGQGFISALKEAYGAVSSYFADFNKMVSSLDDSYLTGTQKGKRSVGFHQYKPSEVPADAEIVAKNEKISE